MNKILSAILFGALMVSSTGTFVSCKDYDDDIDAINKELTDIKSQLAALQTEVDGGNWVTELVDVEGGFKVTSATERLTLSLMVKMVHKVSRVLQVRMATVLLLR